MYLRSTRCSSALQEMPTRKCLRSWIRAVSCPWILLMWLRRQWKTGRWRTALPILHIGFSRWRALRRRNMTLLCPIPTRPAGCWRSFPVKSWSRASRMRLLFRQAACGRLLRPEAIPHGISRRLLSWKSPAAAWLCVSLRRSALTREKRWIRKRRFCVPWRRWASRHCVSCVCSAIQRQRKWPHPWERSRSIFW